MATTTSLREALEKKTRDFALSYETAGKTKDPNAISIHLAPNCRRVFGPVSFLREVNWTPESSYSNAEYQLEYEKHMPIWWVNSTDIYNVTIDVEGRKSAARTSYYGEFVDGEKMQLDFAWFLDFNDDGTEIIKVLEYVDTPDSMKHYVKAKGLEEEHAKKSGK